MPLGSLLFEVVAAECFPKPRFFALNVRIILSFRLFHLQSEHLSPFWTPQRCINIWSQLSRDYQTSAIALCEAGLENFLLWTMI